MGRFVSRKDSPETIKGDVFDVQACAVLKNYPVLGEYLTTERFDDGGERQTSTILLFVEEGVLKACLSEREAEQVAFRQGSSLKAVLAAFEKALDAGTLDWRRSSKGRKKRF